MNQTDLEQYHFGENGCLESIDIYCQKQNFDGIFTAYTGCNYDGHLLESTCSSV